MHKLSGLILAALSLLMSLAATALKTRWAAGRASEGFPWTGSIICVLPEKIDPNKTCWLVVGVHGAGGNGKNAGGVAEFVQLGNCIVVGPSFPDSYQGLGAQSDLQLKNLVTDLGKTYKLHDKIFVTGFSGGSQFAHRFALAYPEMVIGCAAHSSGTWATGDLPGDVKAGEKAVANVPFAISCGVNDLGIAMQQFPIKRLDFAKKFESAILKKEGFLYKAVYFSGVGHAFTQNTEKLTLECFWLSITGLASDERLRLEALLQPITSMVRQRNYANASKALDALPKVWEKAQLAVLAQRPKTKPMPVVPGWNGGDAIAEELKVRAEQYLRERIVELQTQIPAKSESH